MLPGWGYNMAASTIISNLIGEGREAAVLPALKKIFKLSLLTAIVLCVILMLCPAIWISGFTNNPSLINDTVPVLYVIAGALVIFSISWVSFGAIEGTGKTKIALLIDIITLICYMTATYYMVMLRKSTIQEVWLVEFIYLGILGILCISYLQSKRWQNVVL